MVEDGGLRASSKGAESVVGVVGEGDQLTSYPRLRLVLKLVQSQTSTYRLRVGARAGHRGRSLVCCLALRDIRLRPFVSSLKTWT